LPRFWASATENRVHALICSVLISLPCGVAVSSLELVVPRAECLIWLFFCFAALLSPLQYSFSRDRALASFPLRRIGFLAPIFALAEDFACLCSVSVGPLA
jgi:hypothetical protein